MAAILVILCTTYKTAVKFMGWTAQIIVDQNAVDLISTISLEKFVLIANKLNSLDTIKNTMTVFSA